jgi:hypothetical protein
MQHVANQIERRLAYLLPLAAMICLLLQASGAGRDPFAFVGEN